jgi:hypothetical protein
MKPCVFGYRILETKYDSDSTFFQKKSYFIQLFQKQIIFYSTFSKKSNLEIRKQNKNSILISKIQHPLCNVLLAKNYALEYLILMKPLHQINPLEYLASLKAKK